HNILGKSNRSVFQRNVDGGALERRLAKLIKPSRVQPHASELQGEIFGGTTGLGVTRSRRSAEQFGRQHYERRKLRCRKPQAPGLVWYLRHVGSDISCC